MKMVFSSLSWLSLTLIALLSTNSASIVELPADKRPLQEAAAALETNCTGVGGI